MLMNIGVDIRVLMDKHYSGISEYTANLLSEILRQDKNNLYKLFYNSSKGRDSRLEIWAKDNSELFATKYPNKIFNYLLQKMFSCPKLDRILGGTDVFFSPHYNFLNISRKSKLVLTIHDLSFLRYPNFFSWRKNIWHRALNVKKLLNRADVIVAVSNNTKNDLIELLNIPENKIKVIYSGNNYCGPSVVSDAKKIEGKNYILSVSNIEPRKNVCGLIAAYNDLRTRCPDLDYQLIFVGAKGWKNKKIFKDWKKSPFKDDIKFVGYIEKIEKETLYSNAKLFVYPSFYEGFGFPPLEAMHFDVPVVSSNVSSMPEVLGDAALLVDPFKVQEISEAMEILITNQDLRQKYIQKGRERAKIFTWEKTALEYIKIFKELNENK